MTSHTMHVGLSLMTLSRGMLGGGDTYVRGLLSAFRDGVGPEKTSVLTNPISMKAYGDLAGNGVSLSIVKGFDPTGSALRRTWHLGRAALRPATLARRLPSDMDLIHYPIVVPLPKTRLPRVITLHDVRHLAMPDQFSRAQRTYRRVAYDEAARRAELVITVSEHSRASIIEMLGIEDDRVIAIYHGLDHERFQPRAPATDEALLKTLGLLRPFIVYPAALWPHKNHIRLFEAMAMLRETGLDLVLTGETYGGWPRLQRYAEQLGVSGHVRHLGYLQPDALPVLYRHAVAMVYPTLYEGFGAPPLEAMACGCPSVLPPDGAVAEVTAGIGEIADPLDPAALAAAICRLMDDAGRRAAVVRLGLAHSESFTWLRSAEAHGRAYQRALDRARD